MDIDYSLMDRYCFNYLVKDLYCSFRCDLNKQLCWGFYGQVGLNLFGPFGY